MSYTKEEIERIEANLNLVHFVLNKYFADTQYEYDDLFQVGCIGLMKATKRWELSKGTFATFACKCISNDIIMHLRATKHNLLVDNVSVSLDMQVDAKDGSNPLHGAISDNVSVENEIMINQLKEDISKVAKSISEKAEYVARRVLIEDATQARVAEELGISCTYVGKIIRDIAFKTRELYT